MLFQAPRLGDREERVVGMIRDLWRDLRASLQHRPRRWTGLLARSLRARAIQGSNSIEGYIVSREDALAAVDGEPPYDADQTAWINVVNYRKAMDYVLRLGDAPDFAYSRDLLRGLHFIMLQHDVRANPGTWRPGAVFVQASDSGDVVYEGPAAERVPALVEELCAALSAADEDVRGRLVRAAMAHLNLVMIHPFSDGNGRMARALQTLVLARGGVLDPTFSSIEEYLGRNTRAYYDVLAEVGGGSWQPRRDAMPWLRLCLTAHFRQARSSQRRLDAIAAIGEEIEGLLSERKLPARAAASLVNAALGDRLRNAAYRHDAGVSMNLASRDLKQLVDAGLLISEGEKRGRYYRAADVLRAIAARRRAAAPIEDPFA